MEKNIKEVNIFQNLLSLETFSKIRHFFENPHNTKQQIINYLSDQGYSDEWCEILFEDFFMCYDYKEWEEKNIKKEEILSNNTQDSSKKEAIMGAGITELELSVRSYNCLKRAGINTVEDLVYVRPEPSPFEKKMARLGRKKLEACLKIYKHSIDMPINEVGREKCNRLRKMREDIAKANEIDFQPAVCEHEGPCLGTCPACDAEMEYLMNELQKKKDKNDDVVAEFSVETLISSQK